MEGISLSCHSTFQINKSQQEGSRDGQQNNNLQVNLHFDVDAVLLPTITHFSTTTSNRLDEERGCSLAVRGGKTQAWQQQVQAA